MNSVQDGYKEDMKKYKNQVDKYEERKKQKNKQKETGDKNGF